MERDGGAGWGGTSGTPPGLKLFRRCLERGCSLRTQGHFVILHSAPQIKSVLGFRIQKKMSPNSSPDIVLRDLDKLLNLHATFPCSKNKIKVAQQDPVRGVLVITGWARAFVPSPPPPAWRFASHCRGQSSRAAPAPSWAPPPARGGLHLHVWVPRGSGCHVPAQSTFERLSVGNGNAHHSPGGRGDVEQEPH